MERITRVGVGVFVIRPDKKFIIGQRADPKSLGYGTWALPGGHLEFQETFQECAARELFEETGIKILPHAFWFLAAISTKFVEENKHYVTIFMATTVGSNAQQPQLLEPTKCNGWMWSDWQSIVARDRAYFAPLLNLSSEKHDDKGWLDERTQKDGYEEVDARNMTS